MMWARHLHPSANRITVRSQAARCRRRTAYVLDDATIDWTERVQAEQLEFVEIYGEQISRWRTERLSADQTRELDRMEAQNGHLRAVTADLLALVSELRKGTF